MVKVGIIGAGRIGQVHLKGITSGVPNAKVVAMSDPFWTDAAKELANTFGVTMYEDYHKIIDDPEIDAVLICASTNLHVPLSLEAIAAGKHVFCEKPVDQSLEEIEKVQKALEASPKKLKYQVGFNRRFDHNYAALHDAVVNGKIGDVQFVHITSRDPEPPNPAYVAVSGGIFMDMMIHDLDMLRFLSGSEVDELYVNAACLVDPEIGKAGDVDTVVITAKLKNGALASIDGSRKAVYGYDQRGEVFGSKGAIANANDCNSTAVLSTADGIVSEKPLFFFLERYMASYQEEMRQFIDCIEKDTTEPAGLYDGYISVKLAKACNISLKENRVVKVDEI